VFMVLLLHCANILSSYYMCVGVGVVNGGGKVWVVEVFDCLVGVSSVFKLVFKFVLKFKLVFKLVMLKYSVCSYVSNA